MALALFGTFGLTLVLASLADRRPGNKNGKRLVFAIAICFCLFAAIRPTTVPDTLAYISYLDRINASISAKGFFSVDGLFELGFEFLTKFIVLLSGNNYRIYFFVIAGINIVLAALAFKSQKLAVIPMALFLSFYGFYQSFVILRAGLAMLLVVNGVNLFEKHKLSSAFVFLLAAIFHASALIAIAVFFISLIVHKPMPLFFYLILIIVGFLFYLTGWMGYVVNPIIKVLNNLDLPFDYWGKFLYYLNDFRIEPSRIAFRTVYNILIFIVSAYYQKKLLKGKLTKTDYYRQNFYFAGIVVNLFFGNSVLIGRICEYMYLFQIFEQVQIVKCMNIETLGKNYIWIRLLIVFIFVAMNSVFFYRIAF